MIRAPRQLWWRIWLAVLAAIVLVTLLSFAILRVLFDREAAGPSADALAQDIAALLPAAGALPAAQQEALDRGRARGAAAVALFDAERRPLAQAGRLLPPPLAGAIDSHWLPRTLAGARDARAAGARRDAERTPITYALRLDDGRWLVVARELRPPRPPFAAALWLGLLALGAGVGAYPVVRRLTRRLERLQHGVEELGRGDLRARVPVEGRDEVAQLAASFNTAAGRIEQLVQAQRALLANASHELRSPLARVRLALELLDRPGGARRQQELRREVERDIAELDALVEEILLASRLDAASAEDLPARFEAVDLRALVQEECARSAVHVEAAPATVDGDARLLRRLVRNLLENARRYGGRVPVDVALRSADGRVELSVADRGAGVADAERERIFEPFYRARGAAESAGGVGLGLALVRRIAERHGGGAECLPRAGGGSVFRVVLPAGRGAA